MRYNWYIIVFTFFYFVSCNNKKEHKFEIVGAIDGMSNQNVVLEQLDIQGVSVIVDSVNSDSNGNFKLSTYLEGSELYRIRLGSSKYLFIVSDNPEITIQAKWNDLNNYTVKGSKGSSSFQKFLLETYNFQKEIAALEIAGDSLTVHHAADSMIDLVVSDIIAVQKKHRDYVKKFADTTSSFPVSVFAVYNLNPYEDMDYLNNFSSSLPKRFPGHTGIEKFRIELKKISDQIAHETNSNGLKLGSIAPDFTLNTVDNNTLSLSQYKGKYVLLDFWASWCPPCRAENPNIVAAYNQFKKNNFTIIGVSLDDNKEKWKEAIQADKLNWAHVSDLKRWDSPVAKTYGIVSIPANFLIDPEGKIIAVNLRGPQLGATLEKTLIPRDSSRTSNN